MGQPPRKLLTTLGVGAYVCICAALVLLLVVSVWGALRDVRDLRTRLLQAEIAQLRSHAERTVGRIEQALEQRQEVASLQDVSLRGWWSRQRTVLDADEQEHFYAALVDVGNKVVQHTTPALAGRQLEQHWYERTISDFGTDIVVTHSDVLAGGQAAFDIRVPILVDDRELGNYHAGFSVSWFDAWVRTRRNDLLRRRALLGGAILIIVLLAATSLFWIANQAVGLHRAIGRSQLDRATEVAQLAAGLAHEIRNPLHALRINLHSLTKVDDQHRLKLSPQEHSKLLEESNREIQRVERLMQELVSFASPDDPREEVIELKSEVQSTIDFIERELLRHDIELRTDFPSRDVLVRLDPGRLRQLLLNLLQNAEQAFAGPGQITVAIRQQGDRVELTVADNGPGIPAQDRERIFEPFHSTKQDGSGLGLALVRRFVAEADGTIRCEANHPQGCLFRIQLPRALRVKKGAAP